MGKQAKAKRKLKHGIKHRVALGLLVGGGILTADAEQASQSGTAASIVLNQQELDTALAHGPWPPALKTDPSNRVSGNEQAIEFGRQLFFTPLLSTNKQLSCASCHHPQQAFANGPANLPADRDTQTVINTRFNRWFGWDGQNDNLWAQSIRPITSPAEMNLPVEAVRDVIANPAFQTQYNGLFGDASQQEDTQLLVNVGKALAAFQETLVSGTTAFDDFRAAIAAQDWERAADYPVAAQRGLSLFIGEGRCITCHSGPLFSSGEFHDAGVPYFIRPGVVDTGRFDGIKQLKQSPFTLNGDYTDDPEKSGAWAVRSVAQLHGNFGTFRVPGLRNVAKTAPYMHDGSLATLEAVVEHYSTINMERLHADGETILRPLGLSKQQISDLVTFLESLSDTETP